MCWGFFHGKQLQIVVFDCVEVSRFSIVSRDFLRKTHHIYVTHHILGTKGEVRSVNKFRCLVLKILKIPESKVQEQDNFLNFFLKK